MHWLVQTGFEEDPKYMELCKNLVRMGVNHTFCKAIPFSDDDIICDIDLSTINEPIFTYGSYTLSKIAKKRGYTPGAFISEKSSMDNLLSIFGDELLNNDMVIDTLANIDTDMDDFFCRPMEDSKSFVAKVYGLEEFKQFQKQIIDAGVENYSTIYPHTKVLICKPKRIEAEYRFFVVNGKIVTSSQYKMGDRVVYAPIIDQNLEWYAGSIVQRCNVFNCHPDVAYVLDIAISEGKPWVLEVNSINSSGLYAIDTQKFIDAIECLTIRYKV